MSFRTQVTQKTIDIARRVLIKGPIKLSDVCGFREQLETRQQHAQLPEILFLGSTNVGKSSLLSSLLSPPGAPKGTAAKPRDLPNVSKKMGFTTTLNFYTINNNLRLVDSPGYGHKSNASHGSIVTEYLDGFAKNLRHAYILSDPVKGMSEFDELVAQMLVKRGIPFDVVLTKCDKLKTKLNEEKVLDQVSSLGAIVQYIYQTSSKDDRGLDELRGGIWRSIQYSALRGAARKIPE